MNILFTGLVDCENEEVVKITIASLKVKWDNLEDMFLPRPMTEISPLHLRKGIHYMNTKNFAMSLDCCQLIIFCMVTNNLKQLQV